jgi:hypothetical protein
MPLSRRQFLIATASATAAAAAVSTPLLYYFVQQTRTTPLPDTAPRPLDDNARRAMVALAEAVFINYPVELGRYEAFFTFRARNVRGYTQLYEDFTAELDAAARYDYGLPFADVRLSRRRALLAPWLTMPVTPQERLLAGATQGLPWLTYAQHVFGEILDLFMYTDAWLAAGYESWPGMPRGLDAYRQPLPSQTSV